MRKLGIVVLVVVVLLVAAALIIPHLIDINQYHAQIQAQLQKRLGRQVTLGEMGLKLFPLSIRVDNVVISEDPQFHTGRSFATAQTLSVSVKFWPLLHKQIDVESLRLDRPQVELVRNAQGIWNFASLGKPSPAGQPAPAPQTPAGQPPSKPPAGQPSPAPQTPASKEFTLASLAMMDGLVAVTDEQKRQPRTVYDHIDLKLSDFAPGQQFSIDATAHLPGAGKQTISLRGKGGPLSQTDMLNTPFDGSLKLDQAAISAVQKFLNAQALSGVEAQVSGHARIRNSGGNLTSSGDLRLDDARVRNTKVGYPIALNYDATVNLNNNLIQVRKGDLKLGSTPVSFSGTVNAQPTPAQLDARITAKNASIQEAARLASAFGVAFGKDMDVKGFVDADIHAGGAADNPVLNGQLTARNLNVSGDGLPQPVQADTLALTLTPDSIRSNDFTARTGSTSVTVNFALANYRGNNSTMNAALRAPNAKVGELISMARAAGVSAVDGVSGDGQLTLDVHAQGPTKNMSALVFSGSGKLQNANLKLPSLTKPVQVRNADLGFSQNSATLTNLAATVGQTNANGNVTLKNFAQPQVQFTLNADKVDVEELRQLFAATPAAPAKKASRQDFWRLVPQAGAQTPTQPVSQPSMITRMTGSGVVSVGAVKSQDLLLNNVHTNVTLNHGLVTLNPLTADLYGGKETGNVVIDLRPAQPVYMVNLKTEKVDANKLLSSVSSVKQTLYGLLAANVNANFSSASADAIARSLNGKLALNLSNGRLMNVDLLHELATLGKFAGNLGTVPQGFTNIFQLSGDFDVKQGVAQTNNLKAAIDGGNLAATGLVNLADQSLNMHVTAVLNKALSQKVGGTQIGGYMNTALANNQGELVMPVIVTGTLQHPQVVPDLQQIAQMKLQNVLPNTKNLGGALGQILGGKNQGGTGMPQGDLGGILGAIGGKKTPQPQQPSQQQPQQQPAQGSPQGQQQQPAAGTQGQPQPQQQPTPDPLGDLLNKVLKKKPTPQPSPTPQ